MPLQFSNFYKLDTVCNVVITGPFQPGWSGEYARIQSGKGVYKQPDGGGSNLSIKPVTIKSEIMKEGAPGFLDDIASLRLLNNLIYIVISTRYPILYVGISERGLLKGVFSQGRFIQHLRKILVSCDGATNHTGGWLKHANKRYLDNAQIHSEAINEKEFLQNVLGDVYIAIGGCDSDAWAPTKVEGTVLDAALASLRCFAKNVEIMNSKIGGLGRDPIPIALPGNLSQIACSSEWFEP